MQLASDTALADAVDDPDRVPIYRLLIDWDRDGLYAHALSDVTAWVQDMTVERSLTGDLPPEATLIEGSLAGTLTVTLGGVDDQDRSIFDLLAPYREDSPLYRRQLAGVIGVRAEIGLATDDGPRLIRQFTGHLRSISPDSGTRTVGLTGIDITDLLHAAITLPAYALDRQNVLANGHRALINTQAVVDYILRRNGIYTSPPPHPDAQISCTGHGWLAAEIGRSAVPQGVSGTTTDASWWVDGPFGMLASRGIWDLPHGLYQELFTSNPFQPVPGQGFGFAAWVRLHDAFDGDASANRPLIQLMPLLDHDAMRMEVRVYGNGRIGAGYSTSLGATAPATSTPTWTYVGVHWQIRADGTTRVTIRLGGSTGFIDRTTPALTSTTAPRMQATMWTYADWACMQVWYAPDPPADSAWPGQSHTPQASIGTGLTELTYTPDVLGADSLETIQAAVSGEYGLFGVDEFGFPFFRNRGAAIDPTSVDREITADRSLLDLSTQLSLDSVRNIVTTETTMGFLRYPTVIAEARDVREFQSPVGVSTFDVPLEHGAIGFTTVTLPMVADGSWTQDITWGYVAVRADSPSTLVSSGITVTFTMVGDRLGQLVVRNYSAFPIRFATTSGSPALRIAGWALVEEPAILESVRSEGSIALHAAPSGAGGERVLAIPASPWRQVPTQLRDLAGGLLATLANPMPVIQDVPIVGDPRLQLGDVHRLVDPHGQGSLRAYITGLRIHLGRTEGLRSEVTYRAVAPPGLGLLDDTELGLLDDTLVLAP